MNTQPPPQSYISADAEAASAEPPERAKHPAGESFLGLMTRWLKEKFSAPGTLKEALEEAIEEHNGEAASLTVEEKIMLRNMLRFGDLTVSDLMVPRTDIVAVEANVDVCTLKQTFLEQGHTRMPVYTGTLDTVRGFVHLKDLVPMLCGDRNFSLSEVVREVLFVPPSMKVVDLLFTMRVSGKHMAIVVDEFGGTDGLITLEDLCEEIVGEIQDEHDESGGHALISRIADRIVEADARTRVDMLEEELGITLAAEGSEDFDTLGGLIFFHHGRVPEKGEQLEGPNGLIFEILEADPRRIHRVRIHLPAPQPDAVA